MQTLEAAFWGFVVGAWGVMMILTIAHFTDGWPR